MEIIMFSLGAIMSSFMCCLTENDFFNRRSRCNQCKHTLSFYDLIPVISYILLRGRCRYCKHPIPFHLFLSELLMGLLFIYIMSIQLPIHFITVITITIFLIPLSIIDTKTFTIPNVLLHLLFFSLLFTYLYLFTFQNEMISVITIGDIITKLIVILLLHIFYYLTKSIGYGDIKLFVILLLFLPVPYFIAMFFMTYLIGGFASICFLIYKKRVKKIPLVPFITTSFLIVLQLYRDIQIIYFGGFI